MTIGIARAMTYPPGLLGYPVRPLVADPVGNMTGGNHLTGLFAMAGLVIEKYIGRKSLQERRFVEPAEKQ